MSNNNSINAAWVNIEAVAITQVKVLPTEEEGNAANYTNLGWLSYQNGNIDKCITYSQKALAYDSTAVVAMLNLGLCYLIKKNEPEAIALYMNALSLLKGKSKTELKYYLREAIKDIERAKKKETSMEEGQDIIDLFKEECKKY